MIKIYEFNNDYIHDQVRNVADEVADESQLFKDAFGADWEKYYTKFICRPGPISAWEIHSLEPAKKFIAKALGDL